MSLQKLFCHRRRRRNMTPEPEEDLKSIKKPCLASEDKASFAVGFPATCSTSLKIKRAFYRVLYRVCHVKVV